MVFCFFRSRPEGSSEGLGRFGGIFVSLRVKEKGDYTEYEDQAELKTSVAAAKREPARAGIPDRGDATRRERVGARGNTGSPAHHHHYGLPPRLAPFPLRRSDTVSERWCSFALYHAGRAPGRGGAQPGLGPPQEACRGVPRRVRVLRCMFIWANAYRCCMKCRIVGFLFGFSLASSFAAYHLLEEYKIASAALQASVEELQASTQKVCHDRSRTWRRVRLPV